MLYFVIFYILTLAASVIYLWVKSYKRKNILDKLVDKKYNHIPHEQIEHEVLDEVLPISISNPN